LAKKAIAAMKSHMTETLATPSASQGAVVAALDGHVQMALPKRSSLSRVLRRHRQIKNQVTSGGIPFPPLPTDTSFNIPSRFQEFLLYDSGSGEDRLMIFGDRDLLQALGRAQLWLADGTFKVVPTLFFQLYSIHFEHQGGLNAAGVYCLLTGKSKTTYERMLAALKNLIPDAQPHKILLDFESAAINAFTEAYPTAQITGCYFHLCQSVLRKVNEIGLKADYEGDDEIRGFVRCLTALSHVPETDVIDAYEALIETMPMNEMVNDVATYFEHTYIRGRRLRGRGDNYAPAIFPIRLWNQFGSVGDGVARTTNSVEGWHHSLQSLFLCQHPTLWTFLTGIERDAKLSKASFLQAATGADIVGRKVYRCLKERVIRAVNAYATRDTLTYLRAIAHLSHS